MIQTVVRLTWFDYLLHNPDFQENLKKKSFENIVGKEETAGNQHFLLFALRFQPMEDRNHNFSNILFVVCKCLEFGPVQKIVW